ncbi:MAG: transposase like protein, partial [Firmicutes bacterium]|nr:transposase like protein [Bacillota bacterium]
MPRQGRQLSESKIYHVMIRGNARKNIFLDDEDKNRFIEILSEKNKERKFVIYAYCLMDNHVHLLINEGSDEIGRIMKRINISYAYYFNKKYVRTGHLFQDRFKSEGIENDAYLLSAVRYIHNNPVKAGIVKNMEEYKWSSYTIYTETENQNSSIDKRFILEMFSDDIEKSTKLFIDYSKIQDDRQFIDLQEENVEEKAIQTENQAKEWLMHYLVKHNINTGDLKNRQQEDLRREIISILKENSNLSIRQIAKLLDIDRNIVQRIK